MSKKKAIEKKKTNRVKWQWASWRQWVIAAIAMAAVLLADQISKALILANLGPNEWVTLIEPVLKVTYAQNYQGIFGLSFGPRWLYILLPCIAMAFVVYLLLRPQSRFVSVLLGLILGGGLSNNLIDRIRLGYVVDWISMGVRTWRWATYNIADGTLVVSVILLLIRELFFVKSKEKKETEEEPVEAE